jgi:hypothetical protein
MNNRPVQAAVLRRQSHPIITNLQSVSYERLKLQPELIAKYGYPVETHTVQSEDGYILELHRIPYGKSDSAGSARPAVLVHHALLCSSFDWIVLGPDKALGMSGFDTHQSLLSVFRHCDC